MHGVQIFMTKLVDFRRQGMGWRHFAQSHLQRSRLMVRSMCSAPSVLTG
jgi:hypothetical protein